MRSLACWLVLLVCFPWSTPGTAWSEEPPRATLYAFFATWCIPCRVEIPQIEALHRRYQSRGVKVVLVSVDGPSSASEIPSFLKRFDVTAPWIHDFETELLERYHPPASVPFTVLLDAGGSVVYQHTGYEPGDALPLERALVALLEENRATPTPEARSSWSLTSQTLTMWRNDRFDVLEDGLLNAAVERLELAARADFARASVRIDGAVLGEPSGGDTQDVRLERGWLELDFEGANARLGDGYAALGTGLSLSLRKVDPLGFDTALRGGQLAFELGPVTTTVLGGLVNPQNLDPIEMRLLEDRDSWVLGLESRVSLAEGAGELGPYALYVNAPGAGPDGGDASWLLGGLFATLNAGALRWRFEGAGGERSGLKLDDETAYAVFTALSWDAGPTTTTVEGKLYRNWAIGRGALLYHEPPTLERDDQQVPSNQDAAGGRLRLEWRVLPELTLFANGLGYLFTEGGQDPFEAGSVAWHGYGGATLQLSDALSLALAAGYRDENDDLGRDKLSLWHLDFDVAWGLSPELAWTAKLNHVSETKTLFSGPFDFVRGLAIVGLAWRDVGVISLLYGYSTEVEVRPVHYPGAELRVLLPNGSDIRIFGGRIAGGRVCVSGSCRDVPPFEGVRADVILRF